MALDKAIEHGKEHRKQYYGSKAFDPSCRCGGTCEWCRQNRLYKNKKRLQEMVDKQKETWYNEYIERRDEECQKK